MPRIGALIIGQSPRPELVEPLRSRLPGAEIVEMGALDRLEKHAIPRKEAYCYPLSTRLRDGSEVILEEKDLTVHLQKSLEELEAKGVTATVLLCAASFAELRSTRPLIKPFATTKSFLKAVGIHHLLVICPFEEQCPASEEKWRAAGFNTQVQLDPGGSGLAAQVTAVLERQPQMQAVVFDYVGYPGNRVLDLQSICSLPVIDLGQLSVSLVATLYS